MKSLLALALLLASCASPRVASFDATQRATLHAYSTIPHGERFRGTVVGGISGIDRAPDGTWYLVSDDRSALGPARFYTARLDVASARFAIDYVGTLRDHDGQAYARGRVDPESIRWDERSGTLWYSSEGDERAMIDPFIREMNLDGSFRREVTLPQWLRMDTSRAMGPRNNGVFEGMTLSADGSQIVVAVEEALKQDGPGATRSTTSPVRIIFFDRASGELVRQVAYAPEHLPQPAADTLVNANGVVELLAVDATTILVLERAWAPLMGNTVRLFAADVSGAFDLAAPAPKRLVVDFATLGLPRLDNIESMAWGPILDDGRRTLVFVSDDNFNPAQSQLVVIVALSGED